MRLLTACCFFVFAADCIAEDKQKPKLPKLKFSDNKVDPGDRYQFGKSKVEGHQLSITVTYSGGARKHEFSLIARKEIATSFPPQATAVLTHEDNNDEADGLITKTLVFDLSPLTKSHPRGIVLHVLGPNKQRISIKYPARKKAPK